MNSMLEVRNEEHGRSRSIVELQALAWCICLMRWQWSVNVFAEVAMVCQCVCWGGNGLTMCLLRWQWSASVFAEVAMVWQCVWWGGNGLPMCLLRWQWSANVFAEVAMVCQCVMVDPYINIHTYSLTAQITEGLKNDKLPTLQYCNAQNDFQKG